MRPSNSLALLERVSYLSSMSGYKDAKTPDEVAGGALREGGVPNIWGREYIGLLAQYAAVGMIYGGLPGTVYPFLTNYLNMEGTQTVSARVLLTLPWSFKVVYGVLTDCFPIYGYRRRPFMMIGWSVCFLMLLIMACSPVGPPYFPDHKMATMDPSEYTPEMMEHIHPEARDKGGKYIILMMLAAAGYVGADVAADGLVVELAQREPVAIRGKTQTTIYMVRTIFTVLVNIIIAFSFNGKEYGGHFEFSLSFPMLMLVFCVACAPIIPVTWFYIHEEKHPGYDFQTYLREFWVVLQQRPMYQIIAYKFFSGIFEHFTYTASEPIQSNWAKATPFNEKLSSILGNAVFALTLWGTSKYGLHWNWRTMAIVTTVSVVAMDMSCALLTTWDVVRSEWFWLGVPIAEYLPQGVGFIVATYVVVELAGEGNEGAVYGLVTTVSNLSGPVGNTMTKMVNAHFDVTNADIKSDTYHVRMDVTYTILICNGMKILGLLWLPLLPPQKAATQQLKHYGGSSHAMGLFTVSYTLLSLCWSLFVNIMSIFPETQCLKIVGGRGCGTKAPGSGH